MYYIKCNMNHLGALVMTSIEQDRASLEELCIFAFNYLPVDLSEDFHLNTVVTTFINGSVT